jgi:hypothetical protein
MGMTIDEVIMWLGIMAANLKNFPEISSGKKIQALNIAISHLKAIDQEAPDEDQN